MATPQVPVTTDVDVLVDTLLASSRALVAVSARSIASVPGVTMAQFRMLVVLDHAPSNLSRLAHALDVNPSTAMRMVDRLVAADLAQRTVPPEDRRETRLSLTARGRRTVQTVTERRRRDLRTLVERMPPDTRKQLAQAMSAFAEAAADLWGSLSDPLDSTLSTPTTPTR